MKSKEAIRNKILSYTNLIWGTKNIDRFDLLIRLMVEELSNELYLIQNNVNDIDMQLLEKIAKRLTPHKYMAIRPSHTILQIKPDEPILHLSRNTPFYLNNIPVDIMNHKIDSIAFHPVADVRLLNVKLTHIFHKKCLFSIDDYGKKQLKATAERQGRPNSVWLGLEINDAVHDLKDLSLYFDFPQLSEIHDYYEILPYTTCNINGKDIKLKQHFPIVSNQHIDDFDENIIQNYNDHYLAIDESVKVKDIPKRTLPEELQPLINPESVTDLPSMYWIQLLFRPNFTPDDLDKMIIAINTFPASNKKYRKLLISNDNLSKSTLLPSSKGEKLLGIDSVTDINRNSYQSDILKGNNGGGTYHLETINEIFYENHNLMDYMERLVDIIQDEKSAFPAIDTDRVNELMRSITEMEKGSVKRSDVNKKTDNDEIGKISLNPLENTTSVDVLYWVTQGEIANGISAGELFAPHKSSSLHGAQSVSLCDAHGGKEFLHIQDMMSIDKYIMTSKDKIITDHNIICFCESELGKAVSKVEIELGAKISPKPKEGLIRIININLIPSLNFPNLLEQKGVLKDLRTRLRKRSPESYHYNINIIKSEF